MRLISLFSGIGGLENPGCPPVLCCEADRSCRFILERRFPGAELSDDVIPLRPPRADVVVGGWPCQDISVAGLQLGLDGARSGLFYQMLRIAKEAHAHTIVAENVPNLLRMRGGELFAEVLRSFESQGFTTVAWRTINAREFELPHERRRVFIIASKHEQHSLSLLRECDTIPRSAPVTWANSAVKFCNGFYWTAGL